MGGSAFPETERLSEAEYKRICSLLGDYLTQISVAFRIPVEVLDKAEICSARGLDRPYGDVDVIVAADDDVTTVVVDGLQRLLGSSSSVKVLSAAAAARALAPAAARHARGEWRSLGRRRAGVRRAEVGVRWSHLVQPRDVAEFNSIAPKRVSN